MKISLITLQYVRNYGSVLQTYATQSLFENAGHQVEVVDYVRPNCKREARLADLAIHDQERGGIRRCPIIKKMLNYRRKKFFALQDRVFQPFLDKDIHLSCSYHSYDDLKNNPPVADIYCTGSDQTWNSIWNDGILPEYFLEYAPEGKKRIAFSASFGRTQLDSGEIEKTRPLIQKYDAVSVRESSGLEILKQMGYTKGIHIMDPTLILSHDEWIKNLPIFRKERKPYVLMYQLNYNPQMEKYALQIANDRNVQLVKICSVWKTKLTPGKIIQFPAIEEFLSLIKFADYIVTDSFHGTAFSLNFNKQVFVCYPNRFSTRLQSILSLTGQEARVIDDFTRRWDEFEPINFNVVNEVLKSERQKALKFISEI